MKNYNKIGEVVIGDKFRFKGSDHIFLYVQSDYEEQVVDLTTAILYDIPDILSGYYPFGFFTDEEDDEFLGVEEVKDE
jgi:hypothetical protein